jgi:hypothetical protein
MKKTSKIASAVVATSLLAGTLMSTGHTKPKNSLKMSDLELTVREPIAREFINLERVYTQREISQIVREVYWNTPCKPDYFSEQFLREVINAESSYDPYAVSKKGAKGLTQVMPDTWSEVDKRNYDDHVFDPRANTEVGTKYFLEIDRFIRRKHPNWDNLTPRQKRNLAAAAYNSGPTGLEKANWDISNIPETFKYVAKIDERMGY